MTSTTPRGSLHVYITVAPENMEKFLEALKPVYDAVCAEPGCVSFEVYHSNEEPGAFKFVEN
jgi:quinol monooxygenase YgiN